VIVIPPQGSQRCCDRTPRDSTLLRSRLQVGIAWFHAFAYCPEKARQHLALVDAAVFEADPVPTEQSSRLRIQSLRHTEW